MDEIFDLATERESGTFCEVSCLAVSRKYRRNSGEVLFPLLRYLRAYAEKCFGIDKLVIAVSPRHIDFYESIIGFQRLDQPVVEGYAYAAGATAVGAVLDLRTLAPDLIRMYGEAEPEKNAYHFLFGAHANSDLPESHFHKITHDTLDANTFRFLFGEASEVLADLSKDELAKLVNQHHCPEIMSTIREKHNDIYPNRGGCRTDVRCVARPTAQMEVEVQVQDVSFSGIGLETDTDLPQRVRLAIQVGKATTAYVVAQTQWSRGKRRGMKIVEADSTWYDFVSYTMGDNAPVEMAGAA